MAANENIEVLFEMSMIVNMRSFCIKILYTIEAHIFIHPLKNESESIEFEKKN